MTMSKQQPDVLGDVQDYDSMLQDLPDCDGTGAGLCCPDDPIEHVFSALSLPPRREREQEPPLPLPLPESTHGVGPDSRGPLSTSVLDEDRFFADDALDGGGEATEGDSPPAHVTAAARGSLDNDDASPLPAAAMPAVALEAYDACSAPVPAVCGGAPPVLFTNNITAPATCLGARGALYIVSKRTHAPPPLAVESMPPRALHPNAGLVGASSGPSRCPSSSSTTTPRPRNREVQRTCSHCQSSKTPQWREGPDGRRTLCNANACGLRYKSHRLVPEYRAAAESMTPRDLHPNAGLVGAPSGPSKQQPDVLGDVQDYDSMLQDLPDCDGTGAGLCCPDDPIEHVLSVLSLPPRREREQEPPQPLPLPESTHGVRPDSRGSLSSTSVLDEDMIFADGALDGSGKTTEGDLPAVAPPLANPGGGNDDDDGKHAMPVALAPPISTGGDDSAGGGAVRRRKRNRETSRVCSHCESSKTTLWRTGPDGCTLCNACGIRYNKRGLLPEYRPTTAPSFQVGQHSNRHRIEDNEDEGAEAERSIRVIKLIRELAVADERNNPMDGRTAIS